MTWSIVAVDPETGEVGVAAASCAIGVELVLGMVPGKGVVSAQAFTNLHARQQAVDAIAAGATARGTLAAAEEHSGKLGFSEWKDQQFAVAVLEKSGPQALAHTGSDTLAWTGSRAAGGVSVQGNILRGPEVVDVAFTAFHSNEGSPDLAERIMRALEAGNDAGGDSRCPFECPALAAFLAVAGPDGEPGARASLHVVAPRSFELKEVLEQGVVPYVPDPAAPSPVVALREKFDAARRLSG